MMMMHQPVSIEQTNTTTNTATIAATTTSATTTMTTTVKEEFFEEDQQQQQQRQRQVQEMQEKSGENNSMANDHHHHNHNHQTGVPTAIDQCNRCAGCRDPIKDKFIFSVIDLHWHQNCVQCADCSIKLMERCYTFEGRLYCKLDYWRRFGPKCFACRETIGQSEIVQRIKGNRVYHLKCFTCSDCKRPLKAGEQLHLIDGKRLLCKQDFNQQSPHTIKSSSSSLSDALTNSNKQTPTTKCDDINLNEQQSANRPETPQRIALAAAAATTTTTSTTIAAAPTTTTATTTTTTTTSRPTTNDDDNNCENGNAKSNGLLRGQNNNNSHHNHHQHQNNHHQHHNNRADPNMDQQTYYTLMSFNNPDIVTSSKLPKQLGDSQLNNKLIGRDLESDRLNNNHNIAYSCDDEELDDENDEEDEEDEEGDGAEGEEDEEEEELEGEELELDSRPNLARLMFADGSQMENNNLENEENNRLTFCGFPVDNTNLPEGASEGVGQIGRLKKSSKQRQVQQSLNGSTTKRRRRRKQTDKMVGGQEVLRTSSAGRPRLASSGGGQQKSKLASRDGESILNGTNQHLQMQGSILASPAGSMTPALHHHQQQHHHQQHHSPQTALMQPSQHHLPQQEHNKSMSESASTTSNSSTSSAASLSLNPLHHHHHLQQQQQQHQQQQLQQQQQQHQQHQQQHHHRRQQNNNQLGGGNSHHHQQPGHKPTRVRTVLNETQLSILRKCYANNPRPDALQKEGLVMDTGLSPRVIRVWFQNKRCKDKKKSILYKQMQQEAKDGRHLAGLALMRGVPMVASSPIQYDDHSTVSSTPSGLQQAASLNPHDNPASPAIPMAAVVGDQRGHQQQSQQQQQQQQQQQHYAPVHSPQSQQQPVDIHAYQPPWKSLIEYAHTGGTPPDGLNVASPRYQQLMGQIHGYEGPNGTEVTEQTGGGQQRTVVELQTVGVQQQQHHHQRQFAGYAPGAAVMGAPHDAHLAAFSTQPRGLGNAQTEHGNILGPIEQSQGQLSHLHQFQH